jgi:hypothetical protein
MKCFSLHLIFGVFAWSPCIVFFKQIVEKLDFHYFIFFIRQAYIDAFFCFSQLVPVAAGYVSGINTHLGIL